MEFEKYPITVGDGGFEFVNPYIMVGETEKPCLMCGTLTKFIDIISEGRFCSDECVDKFYKELSESEKALEWDEDNDYGE